MNGGSFLIEDQKPGDVFTPEDITEDHKAIARAAREFFDNEVAPHVEEIQHGNHDLAVKALLTAAALDSNPSSHPNVTAEWRWTSPPF